ncbi:MAG: hypothetical protein PVJ86_13645 [Phycisphaerales bacterium]
MAGKAASLARHTATIATPNQAFQYSPPPSKFPLFGFNQRLILNISEISLDFQGEMLYNRQLTNKLNAYELEVKSEKVKGPKQGKSEKFKGKSGK